MSSILKLQFLTVGNTKYELILDEPISDLTDVEVQAAMAVIIAENVFKPNNFALVEAVGAVVIDTTTNRLF
ncbi:DUF2922 domain-containing protein [Kurthia sibirica]|uniref:DUF2922 domain-containing protein n=1 Tax=Kurthia sibirica TaxID=202750 RepID=A0A2U3ALG4_9BACL|nr:DUF2922 domain-containing protein [Kurthia sibirica]PWI25373.1 DUF2922 domain-containing protein [Kurthia sibirica]GEK34610.1 hypothetical protein KSI01_21430 [Kurthia sibirica]